MATKENQQYHHGNLRQALLEMAVLHLRDEGIESLSLRAMARDLGVSQTAPYRHFKDKNSLLAALAAAGFVQLTAEMEAAIGEHPVSAASAMQACGVAYVAFAMANPEQYMLMFGPGITDRHHYDELTEKSDAAFQVLLDVVGRAQSEGLFKGKPTSMVANTAWALTHGMATLAIGHLQWTMDKATLDEQIRLATGMLLEGGRNT